MKDLARRLYMTNEGAVVVPAIFGRELLRAACDEAGFVQYVARPRAYGRALQEFSCAFVGAQMAACTSVRCTLESWCEGLGVHAGFSGVPNVVMLQRYDAGSLGITRHRDLSRYRNLTAIAVLKGHAPFVVERNGKGVELHPLPGDIVLMRAPRFDDELDARPVHAVGACIDERLVMIARYHDSRKGSATLDSPGRNS